MVLDHILNKPGYYLSGSRWWGYHREDSDWDFITQYSEEKRDELLQLGFVVGFDALDDPQDRVLVMKSQDKSIEVALCLNARAKLWARGVLTPLPMGWLSKTQRKWLWVRLYTLFR